MLAMLRGGIGHYIAELSPHLRQYFDLEYISYKYGLPGDEVTLDDLAIAKNIKSKPQFIVSYNSYTETVKSLGESIKFLKKKKIDVLHIHVSTITRETVYYVLSLITVAKKLGIKIFYTFHDVGSFEEYAGGEELLKTFYSLFDAATIGNEGELKKFKKFQISNKNIKIARHGLYSIFDFKKYNRKTARQHLGIPQDKKVILNFGILRDYKGFDDTIKAMPEILKSVPNAFLLVSAGVRVYDGSKLLKNLVSDLKLKKQTKLSFDFVNSSEIELIFKAADLVVLPYRQVSQSGILNIALNFHKPVILSNLFAEANIVQNKMGKIVRPGQPAEIAKATIRLLNNKQFYDRCQTNMKNYTKNDCTWKETALVIKKLIYDLLSKNG